MRLSKLSRPRAFKRYRAPVPTPRYPVCARSEWLTMLSPILAASLLHLAPAGAAVLAGTQNRVILGVRRGFRVSDAGIGVTVRAGVAGVGAAQNGGSSAAVLAGSGGQEGSSW